MYYNKKTFVHQGFGENTFKTTVKYKEVPLEIQKSMMYLYKAHVSEIKTKDSYFHPIASNSTMV
jgi:hypothetical protein